MDLSLRSPSTRSKSRSSDISEGTPPPIPLGGRCFRCLGCCSTPAVGGSITAARASSAEIAAARRGPRPLFLDVRMAGQPAIKYHLMAGPPAIKCRSCHRMAFDGRIACRRMAFDGRIACLRMAFDGRIASHRLGMAFDGRTAVIRLSPSGFLSSPPPLPLSSTPLSAGEGTRMSLPGRRQAARRATLLRRLRLHGRDDRNASPAEPTQAWPAGDASKRPEQAKSGV